MFYPFPQQCNGLIANMLLYYKDDSMTEKLQEPKRISCIFEEAKELVRIGFQHLDRAVGVNIPCNIGPLIHTLTKMKKIFGTMKVKTDDLAISGSFSTLLPVSFPEMEGFWIKTQFEKFQNQFQSVQLPQNYKDYLIVHQLVGKPVRKSFIKMTLAMTTERVKRTLEMHTEFQDLTTEQQRELIRKNVHFAAEMATAYLNNAQTGKDQLKSILGILTSTETEMDLKEIRTDRLKCLPMQQAQRNETFGLMKEMLMNQRLFVFLILFTLLDTCGLKKKPFQGIDKVRLAYEWVLKRRLLTAGCSFNKIAQTLKQIRQI